MRTRLTWRSWSAAVALGCVLAITGCSTQTRNRVLRVFFTGIDQPATAVDEKPEVRPAQAGAALAPSNAPPLFIHQPYAENNCAACHLGALSQELRAKGSTHAEEAGLGALQLALFEEVAESKLIEPTYIVDYPVEVSPLARASDARPEGFRSAS